MNITVVGLGKIGLPLAVQYAKKGHLVFGADINQDTVDLVNAGIEAFPGEEHLQDYLTEVKSQGLIQATTNTTEAVAQSDVVVVAVPLFVNENLVPDFRALDAAAIEIGKGLAPGMLICFETTLPVGTTRTRLTPVLEDNSNLKAGEDFYVAFSPERVFTGRVFADLRCYPKLVGGIDEKSAQCAIDFYEEVLDFDERLDLTRPNGVWDLGSAEAAELAKLAETTYRDVNIGLANQFAKHANTISVDIYKVIEACNSQPFSHIHQPGISVGGHCIPVYPRLYLWNDPNATIVQSAREANASMPMHAVDLLERELGSLQGLDVVVLGAAYRGGVKEAAFSGAFQLVAELTSRGAHATVHDPLYSNEELRLLKLEPWNLGDPADAAILHTEHSEYALWNEIKVPGLRAIIDGRSFLKKINWKTTVVRNL